MPAAPNIAVITAANPRNSGMYSVDLAAKSLFTRMGYNHTIFVTQARRSRVSRYVPLFSKYNLSYGEINFKFLKSMGDISEKFTHIVYWGDFLNNPRYGRVDFSPRDVAFGHSRSNTDAFNRWADIFGLSAGKPSAKTIAIGGNFQHSFDETESSALRSFLKKVDFIMPRDPRSLENIKPLASSTTNLAQGLDCAFLLPPAALPTKAKRYFCYEFGRSSLKDVDKLISTIENTTGLQAMRLSQWLNLKERNAKTVFRQQREALLSAQFVITDIYHLSINSIQCGVPVYGLGRFDLEQTGTLGDYKKRILFSMLGLENYYFEIAEGDEFAYSSIIEAIQNRPERDAPEWRQHIERIELMRGGFLSSLLAAL
jgi:hypothetical protein